MVWAHRTFIQHSLQQSWNWSQLVSVFSGIKIFFRAWHLQKKYIFINLRFSLVSPQVILLPKSAKYVNFNLTNIWKLRKILLAKEEVIRPRPWFLKCLSKLEHWICVWGYKTKNSWCYMSSQQTKLTFVVSYELNF